MVNIDKFLNYNTLDNKLYSMMKEIINKCIYESGKSININPIPMTDVINWEKKHDITLPEDYKWIITHFGNYYQTYVHMKDIMQNEQFSLIPNFDENNQIDLQTYNFELIYIHGSFKYILGLHDYDYGKVYKYYDEYIQDRSSKDAVDEKLLELLIEDEDIMNRAIEEEDDEISCDWYYESFLAFYKISLINEYNRICAECIENLEEYTLDFLTENTFWIKYEIRQHKIYNIKDKEINVTLDNMLKDFFKFAYKPNYLNISDRTVLCNFMEFFIENFDVINNIFYYNKVKVNKEFILNKWNKEKKYIF